MHTDPSPLPRFLVVAAAPLLLLSCTDAERRQASNQPIAVEQAEPEPAQVPDPLGPLNREGLLLATFRAATAAALGQSDEAEQSKLKGRRFELRMRFGCSADEAKAASGWTYDEAGGVLRAEVRADVDAAQLQASDLPGGGYEGAVGFTLLHPWLLSDGCPDPNFAGMAEGPGVSIVQLFTSSDSRVQRPQASYEAIVPLKRDEVPTQGLSLVLAGRLEPLADGRPIRCLAAAERPRCFISALIDRVAIEDPTREVVLGEWGAS